MLQQQKAGKIKEPKETDMDQMQQKAYLLKLLNQISQMKLKKA